MRRSHFTKQRPKSWFPQRKEVSSLTGAGPAISESASLTMHVLTRNQTHYIQRGIQSLCTPGMRARDSNMPAKELTSSSISSPHQTFIFSRSGDAPPASALAKSLSPPDMRWQSTDKILNAGRAPSISSASARMFERAWVILCLEDKVRLSTPRQQPWTMARHSGGMQSCSIKSSSVSFFCLRNKAASRATLLSVTWCRRIRVKLLP